MSASPLEADLLAAIAEAGLPAPEREVKFHPARRWRFDLAWPSAHVACEIQGGIHPGATQGHSRKANYRNDCDKRNEATVLGWRVLDIMGTHIRSGEAVAWLRELLPACLTVARERAERPQDAPDGPREPIPADLAATARQMLTDGYGSGAVSAWLDRELAVRKMVEAR